MRWRPLLAALLAVAMAGCGDDDEKEPFRPGEDRERVAGVYIIDTYTFDPQGSLPETDILARIGAKDRPELILSRTEDRAQLFFRSPVSGAYLLVEGKYSIRRDVVRLDFRSAKEADQVFLGQRFDLTFDVATATLTADEFVTVPLSPLVELVPEWRDEPLTDPLPGRIRLRFALERK